MRQRRVRPGAVQAPVALTLLTKPLLTKPLPLLALALLAPPLVALLPACGRSDVDRVQLETQVQRSLESRAHPRLEVRNVSCPDRLESKKGAQTRCTVTTSTGKTVTALITVTGTANGRLQFELKLDQNPS